MSSGNLILLTKEIKKNSVGKLSKKKLLPSFIATDATLTLKKEGSMGELRANFWLFPLVSGTDITLTRKTELKKSSVGKVLANF